MFYYPKNQNLLLLIPRTGCVFLRNALRMNNYIRSRSLRNCMINPIVPANHSLPGHILRQGFTQPIRYIGGVVRYPITYYEATWRFFSYDKARYCRALFEWTPYQRVADLWHPDFSTWVRRVIDQEGDWVTRMYEAYMGPEDGEFCDYIARTETLTDDFFEMTKLMGFRIRRPNGVRKLGKKVNHRPRPLSWDKGLKREVAKVERRGIRRFYGDDTIDQRRYGRFREDMYYHLRFAERKKEYRRDRWMIHEVAEK